jgi:CIC family chloride channel protein
MPIGPNYEAVGYILTRHYASSQLVAFSGLKLAATMFSLGAGGVSAMFVPLFLTGGALGTAFAQTIVHSPALGLYAAVGMASFISAGYKTPLAAVVFVAEATGGHAFIIPALIGAAVAYAISGDASASGDQRLHEGVKVQELQHIPVSDVMQAQMVSAQAGATVREFVATRLPHSTQEVFPVFDEGRAIGALTAWRLTQVPPEDWGNTRLRDLLDGRIHQVARDCDVMEALRLLLSERRPAILLVTSDDKSVCGVVTKTDILRALKSGEDEAEAFSAG